MMSLESQAQWAINTGMVQKRNIPDYNKIMDPRPLEQIDRKAITIK